jgi:hypothetical protein
VIRLVDVGLQFDGLTLIGLGFVKIRHVINTCACASTLSSTPFHTIMFGGNFDAGVGLDVSVDYSMCIVSASQVHAESLSTNCFPTSWSVSVNVP